MQTPSFVVSRAIRVSSGTREGEKSYTYAAFNEICIKAFLSQRKIYTLPLSREKEGREFFCICFSIAFSSK